MVFKTERLVIRQATVSPADVEMYFKLWNHPEVMINVGFPNGLSVSREEIVKIIADHSKSLYESRLIVAIKEGQEVGECKLGEPDEWGIAQTDVKLFPNFQGQGYGKEIKQGLVDFLFINRPDCFAIKADPQSTNIASHKMQAAVGALKFEIGRQYPIAIPKKHFPILGHDLYLVFRETWELGRSSHCP